MINIKQAFTNSLPEVVIRRCEADDFNEAFNCYKSSFPKGHNSYSFARIFRFQRETFLVAKLRNNQKVVGVIIGFTEQKKSWMTSLSVHPDYRRQGYGSALIIQLGLTFLDLGYKHAYATTEEPAIIYLNEKIGITEKSWKENYFFDGIGRHIIKIDLEKNKKALL